ncbi:MAG: helix-turn-helix domain-containing protein [Alphaproteobacteria bacterium]|nr:helix-turn-helix domain-containing protein [Alphaproteobacteria bacterium]
MHTPYLSQSQLSDRWHISPKTLERWRWLNQGLPYVKIGNRILYRVEDVEMFEAQNTQTVETSPPVNVPRKRRP